MRARGDLAALPFPSSKLLCREMTHWPITWWFVLRWFSTAAALPRRCVLVEISGSLTCKPSGSIRSLVYCHSP